MKLQILVGMISSGKSTYCQHAAKNGFLCLNDDAIVNMLHANNYVLYNKDLKPIYKAIENNIVGSILLANKSIIIDRGLNISLEGRRRWIALAKSFDIVCEAIVFKNDGIQVHANRRFVSDSRGHSLEFWQKVAERHNLLYTEPSFEEGFDAIHHIAFESILNENVFL